MENITVVKETVTENRNFKEMSDGTIRVEERRKRVPGTQYGTYAKIEGEVTEEKLAKAKELVVEDVCRIIRKIANKTDELFIVKDASAMGFGNYTSVAVKFVLPTVEEINEADVCDIYDENPLVVE